MVSTARPWARSRIKHYHQCWAKALRLYQIHPASWLPSSGSAGHPEDRENSSHNLQNFCFGTPGSSPLYPGRSTLHRGYLLRSTVCCHPLPQAPPSARVKAGIVRGTAIDHRHQTLRAFPRSANGIGKLKAHLAKAKGWRDRQRAGRGARCRRRDAQTGRATCPGPGTSAPITARMTAPDPTIGRR